jgi:hypothetical protein
MSVARLVMVLAGLAVGIYAACMKERAAQKPWYRNPVLNSQLIILILAAISVVITYRANNQSKQEALVREEKLSTNVTDLRGQVGTLSGQNKTLSVQLGDCNAQIQGVREKLHAPAHFKRGISDTVKTTESVSVEKKKK